MTQLAHFRDVLKEEGSAAPGMTTLAVATSPGLTSKKKSKKKDETS